MATIEVISKNDKVIKGLLRKAEILETLSVGLLRRNRKSIEIERGMTKLAPSQQTGRCSF
ncbi:hypothetical protein VAZ01S_017_00960 [Vibrio azureus NBRC 104587]|uniref:Uncharacterized protein n=1 Tax=Vibrio azureus NBRC 104587 TaxID=1219077 RepID=U3A4R7_9VIBR|nr:hypothetical protein VAZ01S_017_00960 [Vibrio azureus NBRC 104587]